MSIGAEPISHEPIAALAGEAFAKAVTTLARGHMLTPFGVARSDAGVDQPQQFIVSDAGKIDIAESVEAALQWLEDEAPNADVCMIILDGYFSSDDGRIDAVVGRALSLKRQLMVEIALPYESAEDEEGLEFSDPQYRFSGVAEDGAEIETVDVDADAFDAAFRSAFAKYAPA
ncbi:hypothetical protein [Methylocystis suflitae]|uniref:hypothetical protein n=1 Tax=Methylocystis suflitae TaxID=2951405 RepID=UPI00210AD365|nr:hypothetical protein [Methylocystis suflitae]MCQ4190061.1 hypothetical protein [Methylocystis suflitae]